MQPLISAEQEPVARLVVFGLALVAMAGKSCLLRIPEEWRQSGRMTIDKLEPMVDESVLMEARAIADAVIAEARRLEAKP